LGLIRDGRQFIGNNQFWHCSNSGGLDVGRLRLSFFIAEIRTLSFYHIEQGASKLSLPNSFKKTHPLLTGTAGVSPALSEAKPNAH
jgi:hypothetical protein